MLIRCVSRRCGVRLIEQLVVIGRSFRSIGQHLVGEIDFSHQCIGIAAGLVRVEFLRKGTVSSLDNFKISCRVNLQDVVVGPGHSGFFGGISGLDSSFA